MADELYAGIMTGTSLDAIDIAFCSFNERVHFVGLHSQKWPAALRNALMQLATSDEVGMELLARTNFVLAEEYARAVEAGLKSLAIDRTRVRAIGLHGQTIRHLPKPESVAGLPAVGATIQWGSGNALAALVGIDVVSDFRSGDVAVGGQGAPLVPMFDFGFLRSTSCDRLIVNIGGISNVTWLKKKASEKNSNADDVIAFDCGPGNMMIDALAKKYLDEDFDESGKAAREGVVDKSLLSEYLRHPFFNLLPPKSTGRELFGAEFLSSLIESVETKRLTPQDAIATITELTARSIANSLVFTGRNEDSSSESSQLEVIVSGGGARNTYLMERLQSLLPSARVMTSDEIGIPSEAKEAIAFAYFAKSFIENISIHLPGTTGARKRLILGSLSRGATLP